uniref:Uncharacterized protein n=1 Tax=Bursaphelenchus xylophilus TaxID=6326 RepID=A0A1I7RYE9_BURXY
MRLWPEMNVSTAALDIWQCELEPSSHYAIPCFFAGQVASASTRGGGTRSARTLEGLGTMSRVQWPVKEEKEAGADGFRALLKKVQRAFENDAARVFLGLVHQPHPPDPFSGSALRHDSFRADFSFLEPGLSIAVQCDLGWQSAIPMSAITLRFMGLFKSI